MHHQGKTKSGAEQFGAGWGQSIIKLTDKVLSGCRMFALLRMTQLAGEPGYIECKCAKVMCCVAANPCDS
jgi:hypothetical protein